MKSELMLVIDQIGREKGIDKAKVIMALESALLTAAKKRFGHGENIQVDIDIETGEISIVKKKTIAENVLDSKTEISLEEARKIDDEAEMGDEIGSLIDLEEFGRIAAQAAKQVICQKVREAEWESIEREYSKKEGELVHGVILGQERRNYLVDIGKTEALLPIQEQIPREAHRRGDRVRALLLEVRRTPKDVQVILSRAHPQFVVKLFGLEVPEITEKIVEIKGVVREPGDRTKISVASRDKAVDPVGACVGVKGSRVQAIVRELHGEKIDIIPWTNDPRVFIGEALNPASIEKVGIDEQKKSALVVVADSQLSLAIGKNGQNVRLAAKLTGWKIDIISSTEYEKQKLERDQEIKAALAEEAAQITENPVGSTKEPEISSQEEGVETPAVVPTESGQSSGS
ncbi:MAG TPA: transcription termination factor NusA [Nitrospirales bacterium]|nr:transcription termination/antitermination protein NusA [Nitrospiraceae bacterium]HNP29709.1 transcription termination factor NusA [Nitrospirales bacterium]